MPGKIEINAKATERVSSKDASPSYRNNRSLFFQNRIGDAQTGSTHEVTGSENNLFAQRYSGKGQIGKTGDQNSLVSGNSSDGRYFSPHQERLGLRNLLQQIEEVHRQLRGNQSADTPLGTTVDLINSADSTLGTTVDLINSAYQCYKCYIRGYQQGYEHASTAGYSPAERNQTDRALGTSQVFGTSERGGVGPSAEPESSGDGPGKVFGTSERGGVVPSVEQESSVEWPGKVFGTSERGGGGPSVEQESSVEWPVEVFGAPERGDVASVESESSVDGLGKAESDGPSTKFLKREAFSLVWINAWAEALQRQRPVVHDHLQPDKSYLGSLPRIAGLAAVAGGFYCIPYYAADIAKHGLNDKNAAGLAGNALFFHEGRLALMSFEKNTAHGIHHTHMNLGRVGATADALKAYSAFREQNYQDAFTYGTLGLGNLRSSLEDKGLVHSYRKALKSLARSQEDRANMRPIISMTRLFYQGILGVKHRAILATGAAFGYISKLRSQPDGGEESATTRH